MLLQNKSTHANLTLQNIDVWNADTVLTNQTVVIENGMVKRIEPSLGTSSGNVLLPIGVDPQVHLRVPGQPEKETALTGLRAALSGGIGAVLTMPNTKPVIDRVEVVQRAREELRAAEEATKVVVLLSAAITMGQRGKECVDFKALAAAGVAAFTDDGLGVASDDLMRQAFAASASLGIPILQHAEMPGHGGILAEGPAQQSLGLNPAYSEAAEVEMVARDLRLLADYRDARYHVLHVSSAETVRLVEKAKSLGLHATCEVSPHHLMFCSEDIVETNTAWKMNPPLRSRADMMYLRKALATGAIDFVATDHAPHEEHAKGQNFKTSAFGTIGLETALRTVLTLYKAGELSAQRVVEVFATQPAKFLRIDDQFGAITVGKPFKAVLVDLHGEARPFQVSEIESKSKNSCFLGVPLVGQIKQVVMERESFGGA